MGEERLIATNRTTTRQFNLIYTSGRFGGFSFIVMGQIWAFKCILISDSNLVIGLRFTIRNSRDFFNIKKVKKNSNTNIKKVKIQTINENKKLHTTKIKLTPSAIQKMTHYKK